ncbi:winged helix-turn-helix transcriptional regulator [Vulcanisaeta distributa]|uniref:Helix-turn-helix Mga DNA-binding trans-acting positive regulator n=1 Tax=Vulcanisaeta distributa (strain DSM 14429 / JCM 11212 / NBRC 100878 / IC-017) TaxID=572478 RepID=E1QP19_VULDI|nr:winged helix-turn-helix transcriptional regulator [Vulcanisaeta distributa]ADN51384.1 Helix-turn-helix Mga DNA-binding trans-acting positive regulator [Vulcanisaeta distributa DSM 14429]
MPRKQTVRIVERKKEILELLIKEGELPTNEIVKKTNLSHSQVFYALKLLQRDGLIREIKRGKVAYWKAADNAQEALKALEQEVKEEVMEGEESAGET